MRMSSSPWSGTRGVTRRRCTTRVLGPLCGALLLLPPATVTGCGPSHGELVSPPLGVVYQSGDRKDTIDGQLELGAIRSRVTGGEGFGGAAEVSCGPRDGELRLRFTPQGKSAPLLTLLVPSGPGEGHGGGTDRHAGQVHGEQPPATSGQTLGERTGEGMSAEARLTRIEDGRLVQDTGTADVALWDATHRAGRHALSGRFTAHVAGVTLEGDFESCGYFPA